MIFALISDIHEDIISLQLALQKIEKLNCDEIIFLGDISGFSVPHYFHYDYRNAHECLNIIRKNCKYIIAGNHDLHAARRISFLLPSFEYPSNWFSMDYYERFEYSQNKVWLYDNDELNPMYKHSDIDFLKTLPEQQTIHANGYKINLSHYLFPNINGSLKQIYLTPESLMPHIEYITKNNFDFYICGHIHYSGLSIVNKRGLTNKKYDKKTELKIGDSLLVPAVVANKPGNGFTVFNTENCTAISYKI